MRAETISENWDRSRELRTDPQYEQQGEAAGKNAVFAKSNPRIRIVVRDQAVKLKMCMTWTQCETGAGRGNSGCHRFLAKRTQESRKANCVNGLSHNIGNILPPPAATRALFPYILR